MRTLGVWSIGVAGCALAAAAAGCQSSAPARPGSGAAQPAGALERPQSLSLSGAYAPGRVGIDDDRELTAPGAVEQVISVPGLVIGALFDPVVDLAKDAINRANGDTAHHAVQQMEDQASPDNRRAGVNRLLEFPYTRRPPYTKVYESMAQLDADATVRATAVRACNRARDRRATPVFIRALADRSAMVRLEGAKGLANLPDPAAAEPLAKLAADVNEERDVRIAACDALKYYRTLEAARTLSEILVDNDFSVAWQARRSLVYLTHKDFGYDRGSWLEYFTGPDKPLG